MGQRSQLGLSAAPVPRIPLQPLPASPEPSGLLSLAESGRSCRRPLPGPALPGFLAAGAEKARTPAGAGPGRSLLPPDVPGPPCGPQPPGSPPAPARAECWEPGGSARAETRRLLLQPEDLEAPKTHHFKVKTFKKVKPCGICRQVITREGCTCKVCSFSCHRKCQAKVAGPCVPPSSHELVPITTDSALKNVVDREGKTLPTGRCSKPTPPKAWGSCSVLHDGKEGDK
ncbi:ras association domain-containing protein 5-like [Tupaia chinensis]|uniref:ras association domain-containing protein 5-like n=1 Tax=Tupaia chinensis TaxID=246437 RepID=UPI0003C90B71|nr:ras association domain-containing protein 5-like [Tupaia chinensis]